MLNAAPGVLQLGVNDYDHGEMNLDRLGDGRFTIAMVTCQYEEGFGVLQRTVYMCNRTLNNAVNVFAVPC
jgi:hypothetical protein